MKLDKPAIVILTPTLLSTSHFIQNSKLVRCPIGLMTKKHCNSGNKCNTSANLNWCGGKRGVHGVENARCGKCGVWKTQCGKCGVWKMRKKFQFSISKPVASAHATLIIHSRSKPMKPHIIVTTAKDTLHPVCALMFLLCH